MIMVTNVENNNNKQKIQELNQRQQQQHYNEPVIILLPNSEYFFLFFFCNNKFNTLIFCLNHAQISAHHQMIKQKTMNVTTSDLWNG